MTKNINKTMVKKAAKKAAVNNRHGVVASKKEATFIFAVNMPIRFRSKKADMLTISPKALRAILKAVGRKQTRASLAAEYCSGYINNALQKGRMSRRVVKMLAKEGIPSYTYVTFDPAEKMLTMDTVPVKQVDSFIISLMERNTAMAKAIVG